MTRNELITPEGVMRQRKPVWPKAPRPNGRPYWSARTDDGIVRIVVHTVNPDGSESWYNGGLDLNRVPPCAVADTLEAVIYDMFSFIYEHFGVRP